VLVNQFFTTFSNWVAKWSGSAWAFVGACATVLIWAGFGPLSGFSSTWQLVINTGTTILTWLMVFVIQNTQNRDSAAIHVKLDELIQAIREPRDEVAGIESKSDEEIEELRRK
jgi:low affinity Fe/Cu permease